ncbi:hypothetical protein ACFWFX_10035 [Streptomyces roseolus]|uniref:hypothetical protein n=1 Tax=Streptomyces roseolus TaxID=67358 RepID=UPI00364B42B0
MGLFNRKTQPKGYQPTDAEVAEAAAKLNQGSQTAADELVAHSGDYRQQTAMRILFASVDASEES